MGVNRVTVGVKSKVTCLFFLIARITFRKMEWWENKILEHGSLHDG